MSPRRILARLKAAGLPISFKTLGLAAGLLLGLSIVAVGTAMEVSSRPSFCGSCHIMKPYYTSWQHSSHKNIACVDCHIPPGVTAELRKKYEALSMVARYFTGTYGTNPWTEIDDASCLQCHERRLLSGKELFGDVLFDHSAHLAGMRRGKTLRCTSCHSQIVQGSHIAVTTSTCILCHFKGQVSGTGTARCALCHHTPDRVIQRGTLTFNHADVGRYGMSCTWCHARPEGTDGAVPRERCVTCHNQQDRLEKFGETDLLHQMHVTEHKVDCMDCHLEIQHVGEPTIEQAVTTCDTCHTAGHSPQLSLYTGVGGNGVAPMPSPMFLAGVRCEGCHFALPGHAGEVHRASEVSCMSCHGPGYRGIYLSWKQGVTSRTAALQRQMTSTAAAIPDRRPETFANAQANLDLVSRGRGVHNIDYAYALLRRSHDDMNAARRTRGLAEMAVPWVETAPDSPCMKCHQGIATREGTIFGRSFRHQPHLQRARLDCSACHRTHEERDAGRVAGGEAAKRTREIVRFPASGCVSCHHRDAQADCLPCHAGIRTKSVASPLGDFSHAFHLDEAGQTCADCHQLSASAPAHLKEETCQGCHG